MTSEASGRSTEQYELTIIMSNFNQETYLRQAVESVLAQIVSFPFRLVITDDCSCEDGSRELIRAYTQSHANIEALLSDHRGGYLQNVLRAKEGAKTKYLCLLDADDYYTDTHFLQHAYDFLQAHDEYAIYEANVSVVSENGEPIRPFISPKVKSGTYSKEMFLSGKGVPITQTTGMFLRNSIFSQGVPQVMRDAVGTHSERSFEGDTGRFIMHLKEGPAYYDNSVVGTYRLTRNGIWNSLAKAEQRLITARTSLDYYAYYGSCDAYFVNRAYANLRQYLQDKQNELGSLCRDREFMDEDERLMLEETYLFCKQHEEEISRKRGLLSKARQIVNILRA